MSRRFLIMHWRTALGEARMDRVARQGIRDGLVEVHRDARIRIMARHHEFVRVGHLLLLGEAVGTSGTAGAIARDDPVRAARTLVETCWGGYVAVLLARDGAALLADPSGAGRMHLCRDDEVAVASERIDPALLRIAGLPREVLVDALAGGLVDPPTLILGSVLRGVRCLPPGTLVGLDRSGPDVRVWSPGAVRNAARGVGRSLEEAVDVAVRGLRGVHPLVQVSGGFDSAVVLSRAAPSGPTTAFSVAGEAGDVDESGHAWEAADAAKTALHVGRDAGLPTIAAFMDAPQSAAPYLHGLDEVFDRQMQRVVDRCGCDRILTGQGGDAVFLQPASFRTTVDRYGDRGVRGLLAGLADDARRNRSSVWGPLAEVLRHLARGLDRLDPASLTPHLLTRDALASLRRDQHTWTTERDPRRPGRELQARLLANATVVHTLRPRPPSVPILHPLLAQPVLEAVLSLPTWELASGPLDRGLARRTFGPRLPPTIARRTVKGQASAYFSRAMVAELPRLRERLIDGRLAAAGVLDPRALDAVLTREHLAHSADYRSLMFVAACEAWAAAWS
jgi:asparagine synthase (glutamine-hydrolysing)